jgi:hypothetical protein
MHIENSLTQSQVGLLPLAHDALFDYQTRSMTIVPRQNLILMLGHEAHIPSVLTSLSSFGLSLGVEFDLDENSCEGLVDSTAFNQSGDTENCITLTTSDKAWEHLARQKNNTKESLLLIVPTEKETQAQIIGQIVESSRNRLYEGSVCVVHSSLEVLKQCKTLLGDDPPAVVQQERGSLNLFLPEWADNVDPTQHNEAEMDVYLDLLNEEQFVEMISAKITAATN